MRETRENRKNLIEAIDEMGYGRYEVLIDTPIIAGYCEIMMDDGMCADLITDIQGWTKRSMMNIWIWPRLISLMDLR